MRRSVGLSGMAGLIVEAAEMGQVGERVCILLSGGKYVCLEAKEYHESAYLSEDRDYSPSLDDFSDEFMEKLCGAEWVAERKRENEERLAARTRESLERERQQYEKLKAKFEGNGNG